MNVKHLITATSIALLPLAAGAASIIVPAAGSGPGANGSHWQSELTLHNVSTRALTVSLIYHDGTGSSAPQSTTVAARGTSSIADIVASKFGASGTGAIEVVLNDADAGQMAISSRTSNVSDHGEFGQDIPAVALTDAAGIGDLTVLAAPSSATDYRFNFGIYASQDTTVHWELLRADGTLAGAKDLSYSAGTQQQYNSGISNLFGADEQNDDAVHATITKGSAIFYGSAINNLSGDPSFVAGLRTHEDLNFNFLGVDVNQDGKADILAHGGVLDQPLDAFSIGFPNYYRILVVGNNSQPVSFELLDSPRDATMLDSTGTLAFAPGGDVKGTRIQLRVRVTTGSTSSVLIIPINIH